RRGRPTEVSSPYEGSDARWAADHPSSADESFHDSSLSSDGPVNQADAICANISRSSSGASSAGGAGAGLEPLRLAARRRGSLTGSSDLMRRRWLPATGAGSGSARRREGCSDSPFKKWAEGSLVKNWAEGSLVKNWAEGSLVKNWAEGSTRSVCQGGGTRSF